MKNYRVLLDRIPGRRAWVYIDHKKYYADGIFAKKKIPVRWPKKEEFAHPRWGDFVQVYCTVPKSRHDDFIECMKELEDKMILMGEYEYPRVVEDWENVLSGIGSK